MAEFLSRWQPQDWVILGAILAGTLVALAGLLTWGAVRRTQAWTGLQREMLQRGLSVEEIVLLTRSSVQPERPPRSDDQAVSEVAGYLTTAEAGPSEIEAVLRLLRAADSSTRQAVCQTLAGMAECEASAEQLLGAVRGLCAGREGGPAAPAREAAPERSHSA